MISVKQVSSWHFFLLWYYTITWKWYHCNVEAFRNQITATHPQSGRPYNLTEQAFQVLRRILWKSCQRSPDSVTTGLQTAADINISTKAVQWELCTCLCRSCSCIWPSTYVYVEYCQSKFACVFGLLFADIDYRVWYQTGIGQNKALS